MFEFLKSNLEILVAIIGLVVAYFSLIIPIKKYLGEKQIQNKQLQFQNYHKLIDELVGGGEKTPKLDRQIAIAFELRNFPEYYEVTLRILKGLNLAWSASQKDVGRLLEEIDFTISFIEKKIENI